MARTPRDGGEQNASAGRKAGSGKRRAAAKRGGEKGAAVRKVSAKARGASKRTPAKARAGRRQPQTESWAASVGTLISSQLGRDILADVLTAAARVLRENREVAYEAQQAGRAMIDRGADVASTTAQVGTEVAAGAVNAGAQVTSAAVDVAQAAAGSLAEMATNAVLNMIPGAPARDDDDQPGRGHSGSRRGRGSSEEH